MGTSGFPAAMLSGLSVYAGSKLAQVKVLEFLTTDNSDVPVASLHAGMVDTDMFRKSGRRAEVMPMDNGWLYFSVQSSLFSLLGFSGFCSVSQKRFISASDLMGSTDDVVL